MLGEWHVWAERAINSLDEARLRGTRQEMTIRATQGMSFQLVRNRASEAHAALTRALELAETLRDPDYQLRILHTLWIYHMRMGEVRTAIALAHRADPIAASLRNPVASATAKSMLGIALHWAGEHESARRSLECLLQELTTVPRRHFVQRAGFDLYIVARYLLARIDWVQGYPDRAMNALGESIEEARRLQNPQSLCSALAFGGCSLALQTGDLDMAEQLAAEIVGTAQRYALEDFHAWGKAALEIVALRRGHGNPGPEQFRLAIQRWRASGWHILLSSSDLAAALVEAGDRDETSAIIDEELERAEREQALSMVAELLRIRGELLLLQDRPDPELARDCFMRSIERAHTQGALSWELRTALSLALLERSQGRTSEAHQLLLGVYDRFTEGFETSDLKRAKRLLDE
jgi:tetratricopeptide (TPR) repeat protein